MELLNQFNQPMITRKSKLAVLGCCLGLLWGGLSLPVAAERVLIDHLVGSNWGQLGLDTTKRIADLFNASQDEITVNVTQSPGSHEEVVLTRYAGGNAPDVITSSKYADLAPKGVLYPITKLAQRDGVSKMLLPFAVQFCTWEGELLMLPQVAQPFVTMYNPSLFAQNGIPTPTDLHKAGRWTWDAVSSSAKKISADKDGDGKLDTVGMAIPVNWQQRTVLWVQQAGGQYFDRWVNPTKSTYNSPAVVAALTFLSEQIQKQAMPYEAAVGTAGYKSFYQGTTGLLFEGVWQIGTTRNSKFFDWDLAPVAKGPANNGTVMQIDGLQMVSSTKHPEEAWKWMKFLVTNQEAYTIFTQATGRTPAVTKGLQTYLKLAQQDGKPEHIDAVVDAMMNPSMGPCIPAVVNISSIGSVFGIEVGKFLRNEQSLQVTLEHIDQTGNQVLQDARSAK